MATYTPSQLFAGALTTTLTTTLATAVGTVLITKITICNTNTTTARAVTIDVGAAKTLISALSVAPGDTVEFPTDNRSIAIPNAATIRGGQGVGTDVQVTISGVTVS